MNIYLLRATDKGDKLLDYDMAEGFVVAAETPARARIMAESVRGDNPKGFWRDGVLTTCIRVGTVTNPKFNHPQIILRDFNAG